MNSGKQRFPEPRNKSKTVIKPVYLLHYSYVRFDDIVTILGGLQLTYTKTKAKCQVALLPALNCRITKKHVLLQVTDLDLEG